MGPYGSANFKHATPPTVWIPQELWPMAKLVLKQRVKAHGPLVIPCELKTSQLQV